MHTVGAKRKNKAAEKEKKEGDEEKMRKKISANTI